ncbi:MAG TPA: hypothetical protein VFE88_01985 [Candidatus Nanoarchaeia archaeon]|nr:hypothetical protein [Candidatus Nanoarchaeia archaeon]
MFKHRLYKYQNIVLFFMSVLFAYVVLKSRFVLEVIEASGEFGYIGAGVAGLFFTYGITAPIATASLFLLGKTLDPLGVAAVGAFGAMLSDYVIFRFTRDMLVKEFGRLLKSNRIKTYWVKKFARSKFGSYAIPMLAGFIIASPLPDELGAALFALVKIETKKFMVVSYVLNFLGILVIAWLGS